MRAVILLLLCAASAVGAAPPNAAQERTGIRLDALKVTGHAATGTCGPARVEIQGLDAENPHETRGLVSSQGMITVRNGKASLAIGGDVSSDIFLQEQNKLHCLPTPTGPRLVLAGYCFARFCAPVDYRVIDPTNVRVISRQNSDNECDAKCAEKALGAKLPEAFNAL
ncbi:MAG: hypothetical protein V4673_09600 [Pseudomonadota bacterium]